RAGGRSTRPRLFLRVGCAGRASGCRQPQSLFTGTATCVGCALKYDSKTLSAAGAAAVPPWPPFSITAQTTIVGASDGPYPHHQDWSIFPVNPGMLTFFSAVPVLPEIGTGNVPKIGVDVP